MRLSNKATNQYILFLFLSFLQSSTLIGQNTFSSDSTTLVQKAIFDQPFKKHNELYNWFWGRHYQKLYSDPIEVRSVSLDSFNGGLTLVKHIPNLYGALYKDKEQRYFLIKKIGSKDSFVGSKFFKQIYDVRTFENTYLGSFINEAYAIKNPFAFLVSDDMAKAVNLDAENASLYYVEVSQKDTIDSDVSVENSLVSFNGFPKLPIKDVLINTEDLLVKLNNGTIQIDRLKYIRTRLFDMLVGDWNQIPENRIWIAFETNDSLTYEPFVLDRSHTFTKVEGVFTQQLLDMLGLSFIENYSQKLQSVKKFNTLGYPVDMALTATCNESDWMNQAKYLQTILTDSLINTSFAKFPETMSIEDVDMLKQKFKERKRNLNKMAHEYFTYLQKVPVITGSDGDEEYLIQNDSLGKLKIHITNKKTGQITFDRTYNSKHTKEIWLYLRGGRNAVSINKNIGKIPLSIISGKGKNSYTATEMKGIKIYTSREEKQILDSENKNLKVISPSNENALDYNYEKIKYTKLGLTPIGIYDSDLGLNIGTSLTYTIYGFKRSPYTQQHQLSYNYSSGFVYQGIFPDYNSKKSLHLSAFMGDMAYFSNFFGFGNETLMNEDEKRAFNRVHIKKATVTPGFYYTIDKYQEFSISSSFQTFKVMNPKNRDRYINEIYVDDDEIFKRKFFVDLGVTYTFDKKMDSFLSSFKFVANPGWTVNLANPDINFPYLDLDLGFNLRLTDRLTLASIVNAKAIFSNKYEFYQSASAQLRGFRNNRFIGRQSLYEYTDLRLNMGRLNNPLTPLEYGFFVGVDHGRVWYPDEDSRKWHTSYGGGLWLTIFKQFTGKFSYFTSKDDSRFTFGLGMSF